MVNDKKQPFSGGFREKYCEPSGLDTGIFVQTPFGHCEIRRKDPSDNRSIDQIFSDGIALLHSMLTNNY